MKHSIILLSVLLTTVNLFAQEEKTGTDNIRIDAGFVLFSNSLNGDHYHDFLFSGAPSAYDDHQVGGILKLTIPGWRKMDFVMGTLFVFGADEYDLGMWVPGNTNSADYKSNGGGVFFGISPKVKGKYIGLTSELALGAFSFKQYTGIFNNVVGTPVDTYDKKASYGLGALSSLGFYLKMGPVGINPSATAVFSGGSGASFFYYGLVVPLFVEF